MAALTLKGRTDTAGFLNAFARSNRDMLDYLLKRYLNGKDPQIQSFLLETSILDRLSPPLCDAVTEAKTVIRFWIKLRGPTCLFFL